MKVMIDIPDEMYKEVEHENFDGEYSVWDLCDCIKSGVVLLEKRGQLADESSSEKPNYTDGEIQKMQDLEFAEIQKAYEIGKDEGSSVLDKIKEEFISLYPKNYAGELELGGASCVFSLYKVLKIIDKYKASPTGAEGSDKE